MTTTTLSPTAAPTAERRLRLLLGIDAAVTGISGLIALAAPEGVADVLGVDATGWVRLVGVVLVLLAVDLALVARSSVPTLRRWTPAFAVADFTWVAATVVLIALGAFSGGGTVLAAVAGLAALEVGLLKLRFSTAL